MAVAAFPLSRAFTPSEIGGLRKERQSNYAARDAWYDTLLSYYFGKPGEDSYSAYIPPVLNMNANGRPLLRPFEVGSAMEARRSYSSKRLAPIVDDYMAIKGRMPSSRVIPPQGPQGEEKSDLLTKYLYSTYELSDMGRQQAQSGFWQAMLGDSVYVIQPTEVEKSKHRAVWEVVSPRCCYPTFYKNYRKHQVYDLIISEEWTAWEINQTFRDFGIAVDDEDPPEERIVTTYISPFQRTVVVGESNPRRGPHIEWDLGFCPAQWAYNKAPGHMGMADIQHALTQQDFLDFLLSVMADGFVNTTYPIVGIRNANEVGEDQLLRGPDAPPLHLEGPDSDIIVRATSGDIRTAMSMVQQTLEDITAGTGSSSARQTGDMKSSIVTGRAMHASQGPQSTRLDLWQQTTATVFQTLNSMTLQMQESAPYLDRFKGDVFGNYQGRSFQVQFDAKKDIGGWHRNSVRWESMVGMNLQQKVAVAYEGLAAKLWDRAYARELAGVDDPLGMDDRIERDMITDARVQGDVQHVMQGEGGQNPAGAGTPALGGAPPGHRGGHNAGPSPQAIFRPPGLSGHGHGHGMGGGPTPTNFLPPSSVGGGQAQAAPAPPTPSKKGVSRDDIRRALLQIADTLKGQVFALGDLAFEGAAEQVQLGITDSRDYTKVMSAVKPMSPHVQVKQIKTVPTEAVRLV